MIETHCLIKPFKVKYQAVRPILLRAEKYTRQDLPRPR